MKLDINRLRAALAREKTAIHCDTPEKEKALNAAVNRDDVSWGLFREELCIVHGDRYWGAARKEIYERRGYTILPLDSFILPMRPRLAEILGVEVGQVFEIEGYGGIRFQNRINAEGKREYKYHHNWFACTTEETLAAIINNSHLIHIIPSWSEADIEDAKAARQLFPAFEWAARDRDGLWLYVNKPTREASDFGWAEGMQYIPGDAAFPGVTWENSPVRLEDIVKESI